MIVTNLLLVDSQHDDTRHNKNPRIVMLSVILLRAECPASNWQLALMQ